jgi:hypothetical protein
MRVFSVRMKVEFPELLEARTQIWTMTTLRLSVHTSVNAARKSACATGRPYSRASGSRWMLCSPAVFFSQYFRSQASQLLPAAVSRPVKAKAWISE